MLLLLLAGVFAQIFVFMRLPAEEATNTAHNILTHETLFRCGIASALVSAIFGLVEIWALYLLFKPFHESLALLSLVFQFAGSVLFMAAMHGNFLALHLLRAGGSRSSFTVSQFQTIAQLLLTHDDGLRTSLIFSSCGGVLFAWLFFQSRYIPRLISGYGIFANAFVLVSCLSLCIAPGTSTIFFPWFPAASFVYMLSLALWLTVKGAAVYSRSAEVIA